MFSDYKTHQRFVLNLFIWCPVLHENSFKDHLTYSSSTNYRKKDNKKIMNMGSMATCKQIRNTISIFIYFLEKLQQCNFLWKNISINKFKLLEENHYHYKHNANNLKLSHVQGNIQSISRYLFILNSSKWVKS